MSWIDDFVNGAFEGAATNVAHLSGAWDLAGKKATVMNEPELQVYRRQVISNQALYPLEASDVPTFHAGREDQRYFVRRLLQFVGKFTENRHALYEDKRFHFNPAETWRLFRRGTITLADYEEYMQESGLGNKIYHVGDEVPATGAFRFNEVQRPDRDRFGTLNTALPQIADVIHMEVRDVFPIPENAQPAELLATPEYQQWKAQSRIRWDILHAAPGSGVDVLALLKEDKKYGPQSFASWWLGSRAQYSITFEKIMEALGFDPYFSMRFWESHWVIPAWRMGRRLLWRTKEVSEQMFTQMLRWLDYPPFLIKPMIQASYEPLTRTDARRIYEIGGIGIPDLFVNFLDDGYNSENAARMTAFTVLDSTDRVLSDIINEALRAVQEGSWTQEHAYEYLEAGMLVPVPSSLPSRITDRLDEEQQRIALGMFAEVNEQRQAHLQRLITMAAHKGAIKRERKWLDVARKNYVGWVWTVEETSTFLASHGFSLERIRALGAEWDPERQVGERLPTQHMLDQLLARGKLSVTAFRKILRDKRYSDRTIDLILTSQEKLPSRSMLEDFRIDKRIGDSDFISGMLSLGYSVDVAQMSLASLKEEAGIHA